MKFLSRSLTWLLILCLVAGMLGGCGKTSVPEPTATPVPTPTPEPERYPRIETLAVATGKITGAFSPFFTGQTGDQEVCALTQLKLMETDRLGEPVLLGIQGETRVCSGAEYSYTGASDITVTPQEDGRVFYDITLRDDLRFSDGTPVDIDDVIFTMYVLSDPTYDGADQLSGCPIEGMAEYWSDRIPLYVLLLYTGPENTNFRYWSQAQQERFWSGALPAAGEAYAQAAVDYCIAEGYNAPGDSVADCAGNWFYDLDEEATAADFFGVLEGWYDKNYLEIADCLGIDVTLWQLLDDDYKVGIPAGETVPAISGIQRTGDYSLRLVATQADANMIDFLELPIAPLHYYGDESKYDYAAGSFGFDKGDLRSVRAKTDKPLGAGPYVYLETFEGTVYMEVNPYYYKGKPAMRYLSLQRTDAVESITAVAEGRLDISRPVDCKAAESAFPAGGTVLKYYLDYSGYGYVGINANNVKVGDDPGSQASRLLRRGLFTVLAAYREDSVADYYGDAARVIDYPISQASWLAPQPGETGKTAFFETDVNGAPIYTADMTRAERRKAAVQAALGFFEAAGYTVEDGVLTAAPEGASLRYEIRYGGSGGGGHPCAQMIQEASLALHRIGMTLHMEQIEELFALDSYYRSDAAELWCAAWYHSVEPELQMQYQSQSPGNVFGLADSELDALIEGKAGVMDRTQRRELYRSAMEIVLDWCVELPVYQRTEVYAVSRRVSTPLPDQLSPFYGWQREIEKLQTQ